MKQKVAEETEAQIEAARTAYKPCGDYTAILFFCISGQSPHALALHLWLLHVVTFTRQHICPLQTVSGFVRCHQEFT